MTAEGDNVDPNLLWSERDHGHSFQKKNFHMPSICHHCCEKVYPLSCGFVCDVCNFTCHERCLRTVASYCSGVALQLVKNPVAHTWSEPSKETRRTKLCCVCRKGVDGILSQECEVCEYYVHVECVDLAVSNCREAATYSGNVSSQQHHHWREGNLPLKRKDIPGSASTTLCVICGKTCASTECLAGMRCEWCGTTAHAICYKQVPEPCDFGMLKPIMLPPNCLTIPRTELPMEELLSIRIRKEGEPVEKSVVKQCEEMTVTTPDPQQTSKENKEKAEYESLRIYDGNAALRQNTYRLISVPHASSVQQIKEAALRAYHIACDPAKIMLTQVMTDDGSEEEELIDPYPLRNVARPDGKHGRVFLRDNGNSSTIRVYGSWLRIPVTFCNIPVTNETTVIDVINEALHKFDLHSAHTTAEYNLVEVSLDKGVAEHIIPEAERILALHQSIRKESLRRYQMVRFYLQLRSDPHGSNVAVFVGNLPAKKSEIEYKDMLLRMLGANERPFIDHTPIYYEYCSLVLTFDCALAASRAVRVLSNARTEEDKKLLVMCLPNIQADMIAANVEPLLIFVNVKSGGCQGDRLLRWFRRLLNPFQVFDVIKGGPLIGLYVFRKVPHFKILICGGDGTVGWVLNCLDITKQDAECFLPPCAIMPLGTGNDLARVLRWGGGYNKGDDEGPIDLLKDVIDAEEVELDRWTVTLKTGLYATGNLRNLEEKTQIITMNNYFGIGVDADVCLEFAKKRQANPEGFRNQFKNKLHYGVIGASKMISFGGRHFNRKVELCIDNLDQKIQLPPIEGIIVLNIQSWASGVNPWGTGSDDRFSEQSHHDGKLEVLGVTGVSHLGQIQSRVSQGIRIAQGSTIQITTHEELPVQVDGEPDMHPKGMITINKSALKAMMLRRPRKSFRKLRKARTIAATGAHDPHVSYVRRRFQQTRGWKKKIRNKLGKSMPRLDEAGTSGSVPMQPSAHSCADFSDDEHSHSDEQSETASVPDDVCHS